MNRIDINIDYVITKINNNESLTDIAKKLGISRKTLRIRLKEHNFIKGTREKNINIDYIQEMILSGLTLQEISNEIGVFWKTISKRLKKYNIRKNNLIIDHNYFESIDTEEKAYWLGFLMADGCVIRKTNGIYLCLAKKDTIQLEKFKQAVQTNNTISSSDKYANRVSLGIFSRKMCDDLINLGCVPRKSLILTFPNLPFYLNRHFIRGYFDGDGCASIANKNQHMPQLDLSFLGTQEFLLKLRDILGATSNIHYDSGIYRLAIRGNIKAANIAKFMYENASIYLDRKYLICKPYLQKNKC